MTWVARILLLTFSTLFIRPHTRILPLPIGRALPLSAAGWATVRPLAILKTSRGQAWERVLVAFLVGLLGLLSTPSVLVAGSPLDLSPMVVGAATHPSLALGSSMSPVLTYQWTSPPAMVAGLVSPPRDRRVLAADDLDDEDSPASLAVSTAGASLHVPTPAGRGTTGVKPPFSWPSRYLTRPQLLKRFSPLS
jgi:hypothetical protein